MSWKSYFFYQLASFFPPQKRVVNMNGLFLYTLTSSKLIIDPTNVIFLLPLIINFTIIKTQTENNSNNWWTDKQTVVHSYNIILLIPSNNKEQTSHTGNVVNLKSILLCERNQTKKTVYYMMPFTGHSRKGLRTDKQIKNR